MWRLLLPAAVGLILAAPVVTWWLVGPLNTAPAQVGLDYAFRPWPISPVVERAAGIAATALAAVSLAILIWRQPGNCLGHGGGWDCYHCWQQASLPGQGGA